MYCNTACGSHQSDLSGVQRLAAALLHEGLGKSSPSGYSTMAAATTTPAKKLIYHRTVIFTYDQDMQASM